MVVYLNTLKAAIQCSLYVAELDEHFRYPEADSFMEIEVLYIDGCPRFPATVAAVKRCLGQLGLTCPITEISVPDQNTAAHIGFLGSPIVRINGLDIEPSARQRTAFGMMCRTYEGTGGLPSEDLIRSAIIESRKSEQPPNASTRVSWAATLGGKATQ